MELIVLLRKLIAVIALALFVPATSRADSLYLSEFPPMAQAAYNNVDSNGVSWYSTVEYTVTGPTTGHLLAKANKYFYTDASGATSIPKNAISPLITIDIDITRDGLGNIGFLGTGHNVLSVTDQLGGLQFYSAKIYGFEFNAGQFKTLWRKDDGTAALNSPLPFIGSIIHPLSTITSSSFNTSFAAIQANTDIFMTPVPQAGAGSAALLSGLIGFSFLRRRVRVRIG